MVRDRDDRDRDFLFLVRDETETRPSSHLHETETRRFENRSRDRLETETSRPRLHPLLTQLKPRAHLLKNEYPLYFEHYMIHCCASCYIFLQIYEQYYQNSFDHLLLCEEELIVLSLIYVLRTISRDFFRLERLERNVV